jgi:predicted outer membrane protein
VETTAKKLLKTVADMREADKKLVSLINDDKVTLEVIKSFSGDAQDLAKVVKPFIK